MLRLTDRGTNGWICNRKYIEISIGISIGINTGIVYVDPDPHSYSVTIQ